MTIKEWGGCLLLAEIRRLHRLKHVLVLTHYPVLMVSSLSGILVLMHSLHAAVVKDSCSVSVLVVVIMMCLLLSLSIILILRRWADGATFCVVTLLWWNNLNVPMIRQKFHVGWAVQQHFPRYRRQWIRQVSHFVVPMRKAAIVLELADTCLHEVATNLSFVVRVHSANVVSPWVVFRHRLNQINCKKADQHVSIDE